MPASGSTSPPLPEPLWRKRLLYRAMHRGSKETDIVLGTYAERQLGTMDAPALTLFEAFLEEEDTDIWAWLTGKTACPNPAYHALLEALRAQRLP